MNNIANSPAYIQPIHNGSSPTIEIGNFKDHTLYSLCVNTVFNTISTEDDIEKLSIPQELFKRSIKVNHFHEVQKIAQKAYATRNYKTMVELTKSGYQFNKDKLNTLIQENITNINTCTTGLDVGIKNIIECLTLGANITKKQLDECLPMAIMKHNIVAIDILLSWGATHPGSEVLNKELQWFINDDDAFKESITEEITSPLDRWQNSYSRIVNYFESLLIKTDLSHGTRVLLERKLQDAIAKGDYATVAIKFSAHNDLPLDHINQAFEAAFQNGCTNREQLYCLMQWIGMGAMISDEQKSFILQQIIDQGIIKEYKSDEINFFKTCFNFYMQQTDISQNSYTLDVLSTLLSLHKITNPSSQLIYENYDAIVLATRVFEKIIIEVNQGLQIPNTQLTQYISKATGSGYALFTKFLLDTLGGSIKLTTDQLNNGLLQNLKILRTTADIETWLDMGADTELFEEYCRESLNSGDPIKIRQLFKISMGIKKFNHIANNQENLKLAIQTICKQKEYNKNGRFMVMDYSRHWLMITEEAKYIEKLIPRITIIGMNANTITSYMICNLLDMTSKEPKNVANEILTLCLNQAIENQDFSLIYDLKENYIIDLNDNQKKQLKEQLIDNGINSYQSHFRNVLDMLNFNLDELCLAYSRAISKSQTTAGYWKILIDKKVDLSLDKAIENLDFISINELISIKKLPLNEEQKDKLKKQVIDQGIPLNEYQKEELKKYEDIRLMILKTDIANMVSFTKEELNLVYSRAFLDNKALLNS